MKIRKLKTASLEGALKEMKIGEVCFAPDGCSIGVLRAACWSLKKQGYLFTTTTAAAGGQVVIRQK